MYVIVKLLLDLTNTHRISTLLYYVFWSFSFFASKISQILKRKKTKNGNGFGGLTTIFLKAHFFVL